MEIIFKDSIPCDSDFASEYNQLMAIKSGKLEIFGNYDEYIKEALNGYK